MDTIIYHTSPNTLYGKVTKAQETSHTRTKRSAFSQKVTSWLKETDKAVWQKQTHIENKIHKRSTALGTVSKKIT